MSAHRLLADLYLDGTPHVVNDPGDLGTLYVDRQFAVINLVSTGIETRTLPDPKFAGQRMLLTMKTDNGTITVTADSGLDDAGSTAITFDDVGDMLDLVAIEDAAGTFAWRVSSAEGVGGLVEAQGSINLLDNEYVDFGTGNDVRTTWDGTRMTSGPATGFWAGAPSSLNPDPTSHFEIFDHFTTLSIDATTGGWTLLSTAGTAVLGNAEDSDTPGLGGFLYMDSSATADNDYATVKATTTAVGAPFMIVENSGKKLWYETKVIFDGSVATETMYCIGLLDSAADDILTDSTGAQAVTDGFYFRVLAVTPTKIDTCVNQSGSETEIKNEAATLTQKTAITLGMYFDGVTTLTFYIDRVALTDVVTIGDAGNIPNDVGLTPVFGLKDGNAGTENTKLYVDYIKVVQLQ